MQKNLWSVLIFIALTLFPFVMCSQKGKENTDNATIEINAKLAEEQAAFARLKAKADTAKVFCKAKEFDLQHCILIDFSIHSGKNRFYVWDFENDTIKYQSLCCHGYGQESTQSKPVFSNVEGSYCSSLGKYKIGARSYSNWGINVHYKMHGLDKTNNNSFKRWIVLHSHTPVPSHEIHPQHLPLGWSQGCPVINDDIMRKVDALLKATKKPMLLWVYN
ncbi:MAG: murein L,D-transpeptidase catalytic domain family protein [Prevotella sp.]|jgi:hypothetical protein|nr:murein L,D-transpeptidase catalytic domain family protein [Prevotella sp.]